MNHYSKSGVNLKLAHNVKATLPALLRQATRPEVIGDIGAFGGLFQAAFRGYQQPVLVASMDGVGTKLRIAVEMGRHDTVGQDLVNHCCNDIAVMGAEPLFFLDYIGTGKLEKRVFEAVIAGFAKACAKAKVALIGGETAQMPGFYRPGDYDLVGTIIGVVDRKRILDGSRIRTGDIVLGLASTGLHTNGYSLAREILFKKLKLKVTSRPSKLGGASVGELLLKIHCNYHPLLAQLQKKKIEIHGAAHITGGGFEENLLRILPCQCAVRIIRESWNIPPLFCLIQKAGNISKNEMYRVFNMGIGMALLVPREMVQKIQLEASQMKIKTFEIGEVIKGKASVIFE